MELEQHPAGQPRDKGLPWPHQCPGRQYPSPPFPHMLPMMLLTSRGRAADRAPASESRCLHTLPTPTRPPSRLHHPVSPCPDISAFTVARRLGGCIRVSYRCTRLAGKELEDSFRLPPSTTVRANAASQAIQPGRKGSGARQMSRFEVFPTGRARLGFLAQPFFHRGSGSVSRLTLDVDRLVVSRVHLPLGRVGEAEFTLFHLFACCRQHRLGKTHRLQEGDG